MVNYASISINALLLNLLKSKETRMCLPGVPHQLVLCWHSSETVAEA